MTQLLTEAFERAAELPPEEQDAVARRLLDALDTEPQVGDGDARWEALFARPESASMLDAIADRVLADHAAGRTSPLNPDDL